MRAIIDIRVSIKCPLVIWDVLIGWWEHFPWVEVVSLFTDAGVGWTGFAVGFKQLRRNSSTTETSQWLMWWLSSSTHTHSPAMHSIAWLTSSRNKTNALNNLHENARQSNPWKNPIQKSITAQSTNTHSESTKKRQITRNLQVLKVKIESHVRWRQRQRRPYKSLRKLLNRKMTNLFRQLFCRLGSGRCENVDFGIGADVIDCRNAAQFWEEADTCVGPKSTKTRKSNRKNGE